MKSCAFFGHRQGNYSPEEEKLRDILIDLIENEGVTQFYAGGRGNFDRFCASVVATLKKKYPQIRMTLVLSYIPKEKEEYTSFCYDDSVYLLERQVPKRFAIIETNKAIVDRVDFVVSGTKLSFGGAATAVEYARKRTRVIDLYEGE